VCHDREFTEGGQGLQTLAGQRGGKAAARRVYKTTPTPPPPPPLPKLPHPSTPWASNNKADQREQAAVWAESGLEGDSAGASEGGQERSRRIDPILHQSRRRWHTVCSRLCSARRCFCCFWFWSFPNTENRELVVMGIAMASCAYMTGLCV
jgi:hypothetical protein